MVLHANQEVTINVRTRADLTGLRNMAASVGRLQTRLANLSIAAGLMGAGLTTALRDVTRIVNNFETQINRVQAAANASTREILTLRKQAIQLGRDTAFTASQAAEAQFRLAQSGYEVIETVRLMPDVLNVAAAGLLSMEEAGRIVTNQIASYNFEVEEATRVSDVLALTAASAKTSISELGTTFRYAGPSAAAVGISFEETAAAIAVLRDRGLVAEQAGTGLRFNILRLVRPVASAAEVFRELGMSQEEVAKKIESGKLLEVFAEFGRAGMTLNQSARMFDVRAAGSALILADAAEEAMALRDNLILADGASKRMAETQMQGLPGALLRMASAIESMKIALGEAGLTGSIVWITEKIRSFANIISALPGPVKMVLGHILLLGPAFLAVGAAVGLVWWWFRTFRLAGLQAQIAKQQLAQAAGTLTGAEHGLATAADAATQAHRRLATSMEASSAAMNKAYAASKQAMASYLGSPGDVAAGIGARSRIGDFQNAMLRLGGVRGETGVERDARRSFERGDRQFLNVPPSSRPHTQRGAELRREVRGFQQERDAELDRVARNERAALRNVNAADERRQLAREVREERNENRRRRDATLRANESRIRSEGQARYGQARTQWMRMIGRSDTPETRKAFGTTPQARRVTLAANTLLAQENAKVTANYNNARIQIAKDLEQDKLNIDQRASNRVRRNYAQQTSNIEKEYYSRYNRTVASARTDMRRLSRLPAPFMAQALSESGYHGEYNAAMRRLIYHDRRGGIEDQRAERARRTTLGRQTRDANLEREIARLRGSPVARAFALRSTPGSTVGRALTELGQREQQEASQARADEREARRLRSVETRARNLRMARERIMSDPQARAEGQAAAPGTTIGRAYRQLQTEGAISGFRRAGSTGATAWYTGFNSRARQMASSSGRVVGQAMGLAIGVIAGSMALGALGQALGGETGAMIGSMAGAIIGPALVHAIGIVVGGPIMGLVAKLGALTAAVIANNVAWLANPLIWLPATIALIIGGLVLLIIHWDKVTAAVKRFLSHIPLLRKIFPALSNEQMNSATQTVQSMDNAVSGFTQPLPLAPREAVSMVNQTNNQTTVMHPGAVTINAPNADANQVEELFNRKYEAKRKAENLQMTSDFDDNQFR